MAEARQTLAEMDQTIAALRQELALFSELASGRAMMIEDRGYVFGPQGHELATPGQGIESAPTLHPVWAEEIADTARTLERSGEARFVYEGLNRKLDEWAAGRQDQQQHRAQGMGM